MQVRTTDCSASHFQYDIIWFRNVGDWSVDETDILRPEPGEGFHGRAIWAGVELSLNVSGDGTHGLPQDPLSAGIRSHTDSIDIPSERRLLLLAYSDCSVTSREMRGVCWRKVAGRIGTLHGPDPTLLYLHAEATSFSRSEQDKDGR